MRNESTSCECRTPRGKTRAAERPHTPLIHYRRCLGETTFLPTQRIGAFLADTLRVTITTFVITRFPSQAKVVLTTQDLAAALEGHGVNIRKPQFFPSTYEDPK